MNVRTFAIAAQMEEIGHRALTDVGRMVSMADFDSKMCFGSEEDAQRHFELAAQQLREAAKLLTDGAADLMTGYSKLNSATNEERDVLSGYAQKFLS